MYDRVLSCLYRYETCMYGCIIVYYRVFFVFFCFSVGTRRGGGGEAL